MALRGSWPAHAEQYAADGQFPCGEPRRSPELVPRVYPRGALGQQRHLGDRDEQENRVAG